MYGFSGENLIDENNIVVNLQHSIFEGLVERAKRGFR